MYITIKKLLSLSLFVILLMMNSCGKKYGCIEGDCENGYGIFEDEWIGTYTGEFKDGEYHGEGTLDYRIFEDGRNNYQGTTKKKSGNWKNGQLHGHGTLIHIKQANKVQAEKYVGNFKEGKRDGYGKEWYNWGDSFEGDFDCCSEKNPMQEGTMYYLDGTSEYGAWETVTYRTKN